MRLKRTMSVLFFCTIFMLTSITVFAATKSRSSTYSIYHGVYSTNMSMKDKVIVKLTPSQCSKSNLGLYLEKKYFWGWRSPGVGTNSKDVSSPEIFFLQIEFYYNFGRGCSVRNISSLY